MDKKYIVALGIRISAIFLLVILFRDGSAFIFQLISYNEENNWIIISLFILCVIAFIGFLMLKFPLTVAGSLLPKDNPNTNHSKYSIGEIQTVAFTIVGLYVLVRALPDALFWLVMGQQHLSKTPNLEFRAEDIGYMLSTILELIIGFWLLLGAKGLKEFIYKFRYAGTDK